MNQYTIDLCWKKRRGETSRSWDDLAEECNYPSGEKLRLAFKSYRRKLDREGKFIGKIDELVINGKDIVTDYKSVQSLIPQSHLDKLKSITGEYSIRKRGMELERLELAKMMRDATPAILLAEQYKERLESVEPHIPLFVLGERKKVGTCVIKSLLSDLHVGLEIDEEYNQYNYKIAQERMIDYTNNVIDYAEIFGAHTVSITLMGDIVEGFDMRNPQKWDCEFTFSEQLVKAQELVMCHISMIMKAGYNVDISGVYGNHDRITGDKHDSVGENNAVYVILENIKQLFINIEKFTGEKIDKIRFVQYENTYKYHVDEYYGVRLRYQHGDDDSVGDNCKIEKYNGTDDDEYDGVVFGHLHHFRCTQRNRNQFELWCPCLQGANEYGRNRVKSTASQGQAIIIIRDNGTVLPININL